MMRRILAIGFLASVALFEAAAERTNDGLLVLYNFGSADGPIVEDRSGVGERLDLRISDAKAMRRHDGSLEIASGAIAASEKPATKIINAVQASGEITIEAWIRPATVGQKGPARIVTLSKDASERNFTLAQDGDRYDVRYRTTETGGNGLPSLSSPEQSLATELTHVVYTRRQDGQARIFINGKRSVEQAIPGTVSNWDPSFRLALGNELTHDRPWLGTYRLVAVYSRRLSSAEVAQNFAAGVREPASPALTQKPPTPATRQPTAADDQYFAAQVAPLLERHCVECHGPTKKKGRLDLSQRVSAFADSKSGKAIVPGKPAESLLWKRIEADEMPEDRPPLSAREKSLLRQWIDSGAPWPAGAVIRPLPVDQPVGGRNWVRRLTVPEFIETVRSAVGVDVEKEARELLPPDLRADGFNNTAYNLNVDIGHIEAYAKLAEIIVRRIDVAAFAARFAKSQNLDDAGLRDMISAMGKWLWRGPLDEHEVASLLTVGTAATSAGADFKETTGLLLEVMLQSPRFIYRLEIETGAQQPVGPYELASRLSYLIWGAPPDRELIRPADAGELSDRSRVRAHVERMLDDGRAVERSTRFAREWLDLDRLADLRPDKKRFPDWTSQLAADMRDETLAFFKHVVWDEKRPLWDLLNARLTFATPRLARHYGFPANLPGQPPAPSTSALDGLQALYTFEEGGGDTVRDRSGVGEPADLTIENTAAVEWGRARLTVHGPTLIASAALPKRLTDAIRTSGEITVEAWITPAEAAQSGPARIVTLSAGTGARNFTLGQNGNQFDVRLRTTGTDANGQPSLSSANGAVEARLTHVVYTRDAAGRAKIFTNGEPNGAHDVGGDLSNWDDGFRFALANETTQDRPWRGVFHQVAIYNRACALEEIVSGGRAMLRYDLASVPARGGLLTQGSTLTIGGDDASMVTRGLFVLKDFLWGEVKDPPPCVDTTPVPTKPGLSQRAIAEQRIEQASCRGCHARFEPLAFGLEKFDGVGAYHESDEHGNKLREDGNIVFPGSDQQIAYQSSTELMNLLAASDRVRKGMTRKLVQFAIGRALLPADAPIVDKIHEQGESGGGSYASLITAIAMSDLVWISQPKSTP